jgi:hypothetical protein
MPAASRTSFMIPLSRNGSVCSTVMPGTPIASRRRAASSIVGSHSDSTRSTAVPRSASSATASARCSSDHEGIWTYAASELRASSDKSLSAWSPMPITRAPTSASPRANSGISPGYPGPSRTTFTSRLPLVPR